MSARRRYAVRDLGITWAQAREIARAAYADDSGRSVIAELRSQIYGEPSVTGSVGDRIRAELAARGLPHFVARVTSEVA